MSALTQERFDSVIDWDLSPLEPHKVILMEKVVSDLEELGEGSDFWPLKHQIAVSIFPNAVVFRPFKIFILYTKIFNHRFIEYVPLISEKCIRRITSDS